MFSLFLCLLLAESFTKSYRYKHVHKLRAQHRRAYKKRNREKKEKEVGKNTVARK